MREHDDIVRDAELARRAFDEFGVVPGSKSDPSKATGVTGYCEMHRMEDREHVFMSPFDITHDLVLALA